MNINKPWAVALKRSVTPAKQANKHNSSWPYLSAKTIRKFNTRAEARVYKALDGRDMYILNTRDGTVVR